MRSFIFFSMLLVSCSLSAQSTQKVKALDTTADDVMIFNVVESMPHFPGGMAEMMKFLGATIQYPVDARFNGEEGTVYVEFIVEADGLITKMKTIKGVSVSLDTEAERVIGLMPNWIAGTQNGKQVPVRFVLPLKFKLEEPQPEK